MKKVIEILKQYTPYIIIFVVALTFILFNAGLSPLTNRMPTTDSSVFITVAHNILDGKIVYKDVFDHKGPVLYLINVIGLIIGNGSTNGIWFIELITLFVSGIFVYKLSKLFFKDNIILSTFISCLYFLIMHLNGVIEFGNNTEEYSLLFTMISLYYFVKYLLSKEIKHDKKIMFLHGILCACTILLRVNIISLWLSIAVVIIVKLLYNREYKNLLSNLIFGILGILFIFLPFIIYFSINSALSEFIYSVFSFNFKYSDITLGEKIHAIKELVLKTNVVFIALCGILLKFFLDKDKYKISISIFALIFLILSAILAGYSGRIYLHYATTIIPSLIFGIILLINVLHNLLDKNLFNILIFSVCILYLLPITAEVSKLKYVDFIHSSNDDKNKIEIFKEKISSSAGKNDLYVLGNRCGYYIKINKIPDFKYIYISPIAEIDNSIFSKTKEYIENAKPRYIIFDEYVYKNDPKYADVFDFVKERYDFICTNGLDYLYELR
jgi:hypothetical protein